MSGRALCPGAAVWLLLLTVQLLSPRPVSAAPLDPPDGPPRADTEGQDPSSLPGDVSRSEEQQRVRHLQVRSLSPSLPASDSQEEDPFSDMDAKALAAILLQALKIDEEKTGQGEARSLAMTQPSRGRQAGSQALVENVKSQTRTRERAPQRRVMDWASETDREGEGEREGGAEVSPQGIEQMEAMLQELEKYTSATKRERSNPASPRPNAASPRPNSALLSAKAARPLAKQPEDRGVLGDDIEELVGEIEKDTDYNEEQEFRQEPAKRQAKPSPGISGHRGAGGPGPDRPEEEKIADMTSDLLLQYLLKGGDLGEGEGELGKLPTGERERKRIDEEWGEDLANEKRSDEEDDDEEGEEDGDMDPQTIDRLIEISSKLHLPADDVIDIINDVERKRKSSGEGNRRHQSPGLSRDRVKSAPGRSDQRQKVYLPPRHRQERPGHWSDTDLSLQDLLGGGNQLDYGNLPLMYPRRFHPQQSAYPNYIRPRVYQPRHSFAHRYRPSPSLLRNEDYYDEAQARDQEEELENYIEKILLQHPEVFQ